MDMKRYILVFAYIILKCSLIVMASEESSACKFVSSVPERLMKTLGHSRNLHALVDAAAYLRYYDEDKVLQNSSGSRYMPLLFKDYDLELLEYSGKSHMLRLEADCATVFMKLSEDGRNWKVRSVDVVLEVPNRSSNTCRLEGVNITQIEGDHYKCNLNCGSFVCKTEYEKMDIVDLVFTKLEFEVFGSIYKTSIDEFTTGVKNTTVKDRSEFPENVENLLTLLSKRVIGMPN